MQELRDENADGALQSSGLQLHSRGWNSTRRINHLIIPSVHRIGQEREKVLQEDRVRRIQEMEELKKFCCTEVERAPEVEL